jgi:small conductance mechanosensitive channel
VVEQITLRTLLLRDFGGVVHVFATGAITTLSNQSMQWSASVFDIGISYGADIDAAMGIMGKVSNELRQDEVVGPLIIEDVEIFGVDAFADSAVMIKARIKTRPGKQWDVGRAYLRRLKYAFDAAGIEIPFPQRTVHLLSDGIPATREAKV